MIPIIKFLLPQIDTDVRIFRLTFDVNRYYDYFSMTCKLTSDVTFAVCRCILTPKNADSDQVVNLYLFFIMFGLLLLFHIFNINCMNCRKWMRTAADP